MDGGTRPIAAWAEEARIGPNAITRIAQALRGDAGEDTVRDLFGEAGLAHHLARPPQAMVPERDVIALHMALRRRLGPRRAAELGALAGRLTGDYLLAHRIPRLLKAVLRVAPAGLGARILLAAIARHAWTFVGSGDFRVVPGHPARIVVSGCPFCRGAATEAPACSYVAATLERLFRALVHPEARVEETACRAQGAPDCTFELRW